MSSLTLLLVVALCIGCEPSSTSSTEPSDEPIEAESDSHLAAESATLDIETTEPQVPTLTVPPKCDVVDMVLSEALDAQSKDLNVVLAVTVQETGHVSDATIVSTDPPDSTVATEWANWLSVCWNTAEFETEDSGTFEVLVEFEAPRDSAGRYK